MTDEEIFKKLQIARDAWGQGYPAKGYSPYMSPSAGQEGYEDILKLKLDSLKAGYGKDYKYGYGDPMKHFTDADEIETLLGYEIVDKPLPPLIDAPSHFDLMSKDGVPKTTEGYSLGTSSYNINPAAGLLEGPETANMKLSPYELSLLAEGQQRHPSAPPQFRSPEYLAATEKAMPWTPGFQNKIPYANPNQDLLAEFNQIQPLWNSIDATPTIPKTKKILPELPNTSEQYRMKKSISPPLEKPAGGKGDGWMRDKRFADAQLVQSLLNFGAQQSADDYQWQPWD